MLNNKYRKTFDVFDKIFNPLLGFLRKITGNTQVGNGIAVDMSQIILLIIFLIVLKLSL